LFSGTRTRRDCKDSLVCAIEAYWVFCQFLTMFANAHPWRIFLLLTNYAAKHELPTWLLAGTAV